MAGQIPAGPRSRRGDGIVNVIIGAAKDFSKDQCTQRAAALSYATIFALPPLLIVLIALAGAVWSPAEVQRAIEGQFAGLIGGDGARTVRDMVSSGPHAGRGVLTTVLGIGGLILGATGEFLSLQGALNAVWRVQPDPAKGGVRRFVVKRLLSLAMTMGLAFLLVVSLAVTAAIGALMRAVGGFGWLIEGANSVVALVVLSVLFTGIFKFLPDAEIQWRSVWAGGIATAVLFEVGKFAIGLYLGQSNPGNPFGAARALAVILVWIYYAGILVLFGAEFTEHYATARGHPVRPKEGAVRIDDGERLVLGSRSSGDAQDGMQKDGMQEAGMQQDGMPMKPQSETSLEQALEGASITELFKQLSSDSAHLVQQEVALAKLELREGTRALASAAAKLALSLVLLLPGLLALTAALVMGVGIWLDSYWLSALIVGVAVLAVAGLLVARAWATLATVPPRETARSLRGDVSWAKHETERVKERLSA